VVAVSFEVAVSIFLGLYAKRTSKQTTD